MIFLWKTDFPRILEEAGEGISNPKVGDSNPSGRALFILRFFETGRLSGALLSALAAVVMGIRYLIGVME